MNGLEIYLLGKDEEQGENEVADVGKPKPPQRTKMKFLVSHSSDEMTKPL